MSSAICESNGNRLCDLLLRAVAGLARPEGETRESTGHSEREREDCPRVVQLDELQGTFFCTHQQRLRGIVITCLSRLDLQYPEVRRRVLPALRHLRRLCSVQAGHLYLQQIHSLVIFSLDQRPLRYWRRDGPRRLHFLRSTLGWLLPERQIQLRKRPIYCDVGGCSHLAQGRLLHTNEHGAPGRRCQLLLRA